jgi:hypothetical protein
MADPPASSSAEQVTLDRLNDQIDWYSRKSRLNRLCFKWLKGFTILSAALIPVLTTSKIPNGSPIAAVLGVLIAVVESIQQMNRYQANWTAYRATAEALKHEKYLYLAKAGSYLTANNSQATLAERVEALVSQETAKWISASSKLGGDTPAIEPGKP